MSQLKMRMNPKLSIAIPKAIKDLKAPTNCCQNPKPKIITDWYLSNLAFETWFLKLPNFKILFPSLVCHNKLTANTLLFTLSWGGESSIIFAFNIVIQQTVMATF